MIAVAFTILSSTRILISEEVSPKKDIMDVRCHQMLNLQRQPPVESQCHYVVKAEFDGRQYGDDYLVLKKGDTVMVSWLKRLWLNRF